jgi:spermidine synthase
MNNLDPKQTSASLRWLSLLFLISGFAALIYQIVWQRVLFTAFGVNIESVTVVVSVFMFGLGVGSLVGGLLSKRFAAYLPHLFLLCEMVVGLFGIASLPLMKTVSEATVDRSLTTVALITYLVLCIPTIFMGATLPILVTYLDRHYRNVSTSLVRLYFLNTLGSAIACFVTVDLLFRWLGQQAVVMVAAFCNLMVGLLVYRYVRAGGEETAQAGSAEAEKGDRPLEERGTVPFFGFGARQSLRFLLILLLSCGVGYISLSQEILWLRVMSYSTGGRPEVFAHVLGFLLLGIAYGARDTKRFYHKDRRSSLTFVATALSLLCVLFYVCVPAIAQLSTYLGFLGASISYLAVLLLAFLAGGLFPALCYYGIESGAAVGLALSFVYAANIVGSTAGPLLTGFVFLEQHTLEQLILYLSVGGLCLAVLVWFASPVSAWMKLAGAGTLGCLITGMLAFHGELYAHVLEKLHYKSAYAENGPYKHVLQNRNGIIAVAAQASDTVYGGGMYDGTFNIDPVLNSNLITRAYMFAALHPDPQEVLEIGLSSGSWARVIAAYPAVKKLTIVEINPAYEHLLRCYPQAAALLHDPRVSVHFDDGRRWLRRNPDRKFDVILMNTTFHWRDMVTNLLSDEFLRLCKAHLKEGGMVYYNTTSCEDALFTAAQVFRHVVPYLNFVAASDRPFSLTAADKRRNLLRFQIAGEPVFSGSDPAVQKVLEELATSDTTDRAEELRRKKGLWQITDDNMAPEFKRRFSGFSVK